MPLLTREGTAQEQWHTRTLALLKGSGTLALLKSNGTLTEIRAYPCETPRELKFAALIGELADAQNRVRRSTRLLIGPVKVVSESHRRAANPGHTRSTGCYPPARWTAASRTKISTRRFLAWLVADSLGTVGRCSPHPPATIRPGLTPRLCR